MSTTTYKELIEQAQEAHENSALPLSYGPDMYAAYAYLRSEEMRDLENWYTDAEEQYNGEWSDVEDFAREMAESIGAIDPNAKWPLGHIDWTGAARDLMMDYSEHGGHYFRD